MLLRRFTDFILRGQLQAVVAVVVLGLVPFVGSSLSILITAFITLRKGAAEGALLLIVAMLPYVVPYLFAYGAMDTETSQALVMLVAISVVTAINVLTWLFALMLRRYSNWSLVIETAALIGLIFVAVIHVIYPNVGAWWAEQLTAYFSKTASLFGQIAPEGAAVPADAQIQMVARGKQYATGFLTASIVANALLQVVIARWWQAVIFNPGGLRKELHQIRLGHVAAVIFILGFILSYLDNVISLDMMPVLYMAFGAAGLSLAHSLLAANKTGWVWLFIIYVGVLFLFPAGVVIVAMAALLDTLLDFRKRLRKS